MYKDTSYLGSRLPQVTLIFQREINIVVLVNGTKHLLALSRVEPRVTKFDKVPMF